MQWQCRIAPSLGGGFAGTPNEVWGTTDYVDDEAPTVFFGLYGLPDFYALWRHKGERAVLWAGSDIRHFINGYWLDDEGELTLEESIPDMADWLSNNCKHYVENWIEERALKRLGIIPKIAPSFLGNVDDYEVNFEPNNKYYTSVSGNDFELYGWDQIEYYAIGNPHCEFHLYGNTEPWESYIANVVVHGRVPQEQMDEEIKKMQGAIRLTNFDGFSEILAKSVLWGQHPVSPHINYPHMDKKPEKHTKPNTEGRDYYRAILNAYPWNVKVAEK